MSSPPFFRFGAAIDAGSSGSRIYLYRWPETIGGEEELDDGGGSSSSSSRPRRERFARVERKAVFSDERTPGIGDDDGVGLDALDELVHAAADFLRAAGVDPGNVPIHLGATAGMRILAEEGPSLEGEILSAARSSLRSSGFLFRDGWARTISGEEEGVYDWLAANYLLEGGDGGDFLASPSAAYGALDLGGASAQISFPLSTPSAGGGERSLPPSADVHHREALRIDDVDYPLYTRSFLHYGVDQARVRYDTDVAAASRNNPCYPAGYTDPDSDVSGSSEWEGCMHSVASLFDETPSCDEGKEERCPIGGARRPPIEDGRRFIAMSAFVYIWDYLGLQTGKETEDLNALNGKARRICNLTHEQQLARHRRRMENRPSKRTTTKPHAQCFNAAFAYHLLTKGYGIPASETPIEVYFDIDRTKVQWALGLMLVEANGLGIGSGLAFPKGEGGRRQLDVVAVGDAYGRLFGISAAVLAALTLALGYLPCRRKRAPSVQDPCLPVVNPNVAVQNLSPRKGR